MSNQPPAIRSAKAQQVRDIAAVIGFTLLVGGIALFDYRVALIIAGATLLLISLLGTIKES